MNQRLLCVVIEYDVEKTACIRHPIALTRRIMPFSTLCDIHCVLYCPYANTAMYSTHMVCPVLSVNMYVADVSMRWHVLCALCLPAKVAKLPRSLPLLAGLGCTGCESATAQPRRPLAAGGSTNPLWRADQRLRRKKRKAVSSHTTTTLRTETVTTHIFILLHTNT